MGIGFSFVIVAALIMIAIIGTVWLRLNLLFGVIIPYAALLTFLIGTTYRIIAWGRTPVPFRIPTTAGQGVSLPWIRQDKFDNPSTIFGVVVRMLMELLFFRSLFRNTKSEIVDGKLVHGSEKFLWLFGLIFHYSFLIVLIRHYRFFIQNVPQILQTVEHLDAFFQVGVPLMYITDLTLLGAVTFLFFRRVVMPQIKSISLPADYFPLLLIFSIGTTGILMRYFVRVDITSVKQLTMGLASLSFTAPEGVGAIFYIHVFLVSVFFAYFPWSKLMHMGGVLLSSTRNMVNNSRMVRHVNPWNYPVHAHTYEEYEDEFREKMKKADIPVEKE